jgi:hypothetical protein
MPRMSREARLAVVKHILATGQVPPSNAAAPVLTSSETSPAAEMSKDKPLPTSSGIAEIPAAYKALKDLEPHCKGNYSILKQYWPYFISRTGLNVPVALRKSGVIVDVETLGMGGNKVELQYINIRGPNGRPQLFLNVGTEYEYLGRWLDAAAGYNYQCVFEQAEIKVTQTTALNLSPQPNISRDR